MTTYVSVPYAQPEGLPVTGAADHVPERLARIVFGRRTRPLRVAYLDTLPPAVAWGHRTPRPRRGWGRLLPMPPLGRARATPQPFATDIQSISLTYPQPYEPAA